jgi:hypothetical protein
MSEEIDMICTLTGCDSVMAKEAYSQTNDVTLAVDKILLRQSCLLKRNVLWMKLDLNLKKYARQ